MNKPKGTYQLILLLLLPALSLVAQDSLTWHRVFAPKNMLFGLAHISEHPEYRNTGQPVSFMICDDHAIDLHLPAYQAKHTLIHKPLLAHDFNWSVSPQFKLKSAFVTKIISNADKRLNLNLLSTSP